MLKSCVLSYILDVLGSVQLRGQRLVAAMDEWDVGSVFPSGHYVTSLGPVGEVSAAWLGLVHLTSQYLRRPGTCTYYRGLRTRNYPYISSFLCSIARSFFPSKPPSVPTPLGSTLHRETTPSQKCSPQGDV